MIWRLKDRLEVTRINLNDGTVDGVVNTITGRQTALRDGFYIRRAAEKRIPCFTPLDTVRATPFQSTEERNQLEAGYS
ncbi:MAG: hypothetical protein CL874_00945 [Dehalococcoidales bacterium]|jgi:hypothetical protein|nr:hypothetical protein [Dehalococcoidales bacterium]MDP6825336.1 hypothetical protein [Dehalococcoidales bacterium]|tara:strand:+ start:273 stop:506 length:234 start_codon:yes stop_codon:yes gene_type:complete